MVITTSELVYINEAAKALKQKDFILINNAIIGIDEIYNMVTYILLDTNFISNYFDGIIINQRALSAFIKTLSIESDFKFDSVNNIIRTISGGELLLRYDPSIMKMADSRFKYALELNNIQPTIQETDASDIASQIQSMKSADGAMGVNFNGYFMTLFPSFLPLNKNDKMYISILDQPFYNTFIAKFHIKKKKFDIITYIHYIKV